MTRGMKLNKLRIETSDYASTTYNNRRIIALLVNVISCEVRYVIDHPRR